MAKRKEERRRAHAALTAQALSEHNTLHPPLYGGWCGLFRGYHRADATCSGSSQQQVTAHHSPSRAIGAPAAHSGEECDVGVDQNRAAPLAPHTSAPETQHPLS
eukprot:12707813-Heterocapsa_arctica.AAC.1